MITPPPLRAGDTVGITAPSGCLSEPEIMPAVEMIRSWGLHVVFGRHLFRRRNSFAGTDHQRASDFQQMLDDDNIRAILCARGGYGAIRIIGQISFDHFVKQPKWIAGYSDITVIHACLQQRIGAESIHGAMPRVVPPRKPDLASFDSLRAVLFGELKQYTLRPHHLNIKGKATGTLVGGNLSVLHSLAGTPFDIDTAGKILFIEDLNEYLYHIDRMIMNLKLRGWLANLNGLIIGGMLGMKASSSGFRKPANDIIREAVAGYGYPVMFGFPAGHGHPNVSLVMGRKINMEVGSDHGRLVF